MILKTNLQKIRQQQEKDLAKLTMGAFTFIKDNSLEQLPENCTPEKKKKEIVKKPHKKKETVSDSRANASQAKKNSHLGHNKGAKDVS